MGNQQYLEDEIKKSGLKKEYLARKLGITRQSFSMKCKDPSSFTAAQVSILCNELKITQFKKKDKIFFA